MNSPGVPNYAIRERTVEALTAILADFVARGLPHRRVARLTGLLVMSGVVLPSGLALSVADYLLGKRQADYGWVDCEDTAWCLFALRHLKSLGEEDCSRTMTWLQGERVEDGWGYCRRDEACIPITATIRWLVPELADYESAVWLRNTWQTDLSSDFRLSYKAAWFLLARLDAGIDSSLFEATIRHLAEDQRTDGGWGPWRDHPAPTCAFSTGIAMLALARSNCGALPAVRDVLEKSCGFFRCCQSPDGLFPTHYIEEGSAWLLAGLSEAYKSLESTGLGR